MKDKESNQNYNTPILLLIGVVIAVLIVCYLVIDALIGFKNIKEVIPIIISIFGLFATFGGAYLGAKISGDNARELYEKQKKEQDDNIYKKIDLIVNVKLIKIYDHAAMFQKSIEENYEYDKNNDTLIDINNAIDGYAEPIIELLEDREIHNGSNKMKENLLVMYNECNRLINYILTVDIEQSGLHTDDNFMFLTKEENDRRIHLAHTYKSVKFAEYVFVKEVLDEQLDNILHSITKENVLVNNLDIKNGAKRQFTIDL
ncbi:hypothetical protein QI036_01650 [Staphylococcus saprophyticus]|uniref:hypothetical protein n=1 Tax=Staphylococcus saprophyticus TaxID=29385 RepID=UPI0022EAB43B|nr:hypothetical protein [Staphylococcus saprophyticus]MDW4397457.1 hypothetical protein [Staphylococcus saprophyticus]